MDRLGTAIHGFLATALWKWRGGRHFQEHPLVIHDGVVDDCHVEQGQRVVIAGSVLKVLKSAALGEIAGWPD